MKTINIISQLLFFIGLILKLFHIHFNAILMLIGLAGVIISLVVGLIKKQKKTTLLLTLTNFAWLALIFLTVKFLPIQLIFLVISIILTLLSVILLIRKGQAKSLWPLLIFIAIAVFFYFQPTHERYKLLSIDWNYEIETDYITWDKYSWHLYQNGEYSKALEASEKARNMAIQFKDSEWVEFIDAHYKAIKERNWDRYRNS